jgi:UDP-N-acetylmuramate--alanine ligase
MGFKQILCVFQAHTFSRTKALYGEFLSAFSNASELIITPTYSARESGDEKTCAIALASALDALYLDDFTKISDQIRKTEADCVVIMGAGDIDRFVEPIAKMLGKK